MSLARRAEGGARLGFAALALGLSLQGCGNSSDGAAGGSGGATSNSGGQGGIAPGGNPGSDPCVGPCSDSAPRPTPLPPPKCPVEEPLAGAPCTEDGLECSYGDAPTPRCRKYYQCSAGAWLLEPSDAYPCVVNSECPAAPSSGDACKIEVPGVPCVYDGLLCFCEGSSDPAPGAAGHWGCYGPPQNPACPALLPNIGAGCATQALECHYASNGCTAPPSSTVFCRDGAWEAGQELLCHSK